MRRFLPILICFLLLILLAQGCGPDSYRYQNKYPGIEQYTPYGYYELSTGYSYMECSWVFTEFLNSNYGYLLRPGYTYIDIIPYGYDAIDVWIEDLGVSVMAYYDNYTGFYYGSFWNSGLVNDCQIEESIDLWIEYTGYEIYVDIINSFRNIPYSYYCPFYSNSCENTFSYIGRPI